ncbi:MAG: hypothetical protein HQL58_01210 [Magnetococcales bacterium]|nr:hypothetical protein [Magnetococcales bacterium]
MPYITSAERIGEKRGIEKGIEWRNKGAALHGMLEYASIRGERKQATLVFWNGGQTRG